MPVGSIGSLSQSIPPIRVIFGPASGENRSSQKTDKTSQNNKKIKGLEGDRVTLSDEAKRAFAIQEQDKVENKKVSSVNQFSEEERREVEKLRRRDSKVRRHEMAHKMAGGSITGQIIYEYDTGPDGKRYATGGHISIDTSSESSPEATLRKAAAIRRAALAPADPSPADRGVAQRAQGMATRARQEIAEERQEAQGKFRLKFALLFRNLKRALPPPHSFEA